MLPCLGPGFGNRFVIQRPWYGISLADSDIQIAGGSSNLYNAGLAARDIFVFPLELTDLPQACCSNSCGYTGPGCWILGLVVRVRARRRRRRWGGWKCGEVASTVGRLRYSQWTGVHEEWWRVIKQRGRAVMLLAAGNGGDGTTD